MTNKRGLYPVYCCEEYLCDAPKSTNVKCPKCNRWSRIEPDHPIPDEPVKETQLQLTPE